MSLRVHRAHLLADRYAADDLINEAADTLETLVSRCPPQPTLSYSNKDDLSLYA